MEGNVTGTLRRSEIWLAMVEIKPVNGNNDLEEAKGAFVSVAYRASSEGSFIELVKASFADHDFEVLDMEEIERADQLPANLPPDALKLTLLSEVEKEHEFAWGDFYTYDEE